MDGLIKINGKDYLGFHQKSEKEEDYGQSQETKQADASMGFLQDWKHSKIQLKEKELEKDQA